MNTLSKQFLSLFDTNYSKFLNLGSIIVKACLCANLIWKVIRNKNKKTKKPKRMNFYLHFSVHILHKCHN